jgi:hypothetical protein
MASLKGFSSFTVSTTITTHFGTAAAMVEDGSTLIRMNRSCDAAAWAERHMTIQGKS